MRGSSKPAAAFRDFGADERTSVRALYTENHARQTFDFGVRQREAYLPLRHGRMSVWRAMESLAELVDDSDPDLEASQLDHALQTSEALRADGAPRWLVLTGFLHDLGKLLTLFGEPQWAVVGDTFPVGCGFSEKIVFPELFDANPDRAVPKYSSRLGVYEEGCGLENVHLSWGHDEYLYHVLREHLPEPALAIIRYHSFYAWHEQGEYCFLMNHEDHERLAWVQRFNRYDLYSKSEVAPDFARLRPWYADLVAELLPPELDW